MGELDIPDEAWPPIPNTGHYWSVSDVIEYAAPHIVRAAQVAILRELEEKLENEEWPNVRAVRVLVALMRVHREADNV